MIIRSLSLITLCLTAPLSYAADNKATMSSKPVHKKQSSSRSLLPIATLNFAQTHVIPPAGKTWNLAGIPPDQQRSLKLVGNRNTLAIVQVNVSLYPKEILYMQIASPQGKTVTLNLRSPATFPKTESNGPIYPQSGYWALIPAGQIVNGMNVRVIGQSSSGTRILLPYQPVEVGSSPILTIRPINLYLFGSNPSNYTNPLVFDKQAINEYFAKVPVTQVKFDPLPDIIWDYLVMPPGVRSIPQRGFIVKNTDDMLDGSFNAPISGGFSVVNALQEANGEKATPHYYYGVTLAKYSDGTIYWGGGAGYNYANYAIGDPYEGVFFHEIGHAFGMPHALDGYNMQKYPYPGGSLLGSAWGYDSIRNILLAPFVPSDVPEKPIDCTWGGMVLQRDSEGRCIKQDPMQGGARLQSAQDRFAMFSDYNAAEVQWAIEGQTTLAPDGSHIYSNQYWGLVEKDPSFKSGFKRWDKIDKKYVQWIPPQGPQNSQYGYNRALPIAQGVPVHAIVVTLSTDPSPTLTQIYPPLHYKGNLIEHIDPTDPAQLATINLSSGKYKNYCTFNGCDYTLRVTYNDGSILYRLIPKGFRLGPVDSDPTAHDPTHWASMLVVGINVPGEKPLSKIELLSTPQAYDKTVDYFAKAAILDTRTTQLN